MANLNAPYKIAIIGRPNVGKSTLFNRIVGRRQSITEKKAGTTRDRVSAIVNTKDHVFEIVDTGGFDIGRKDRLSELIKRQIKIAIEKSNIILFVCDITEGVMPLDEEILPILRRSGKDIMLVVNKVDNEKLKIGVSEFFKFGIEDLYPVSALHDIGMSPLINRLIKKMKPSGQIDMDSKSVIKVAIVGRPNVGKSSLVNKVINEERVIVHEEPGTTRDSIDIHLSRNGTKFIFIDTAGMRHKRKIKEAADVYSLLRARKSVQHSDICLVMIDAYEGLMRDDIRIISLVDDYGKGCILVVNKWDLISDIEMSRYKNALVKRMHYIKGIPVLFASCKTGLNLEEVFPLIKLVHRNINAKFSKEELDRILDLMQKTGRIPLVRSGKLMRIHKMMQEDMIPPTFKLFVTNPPEITKDYIEAIKNVLRDELGLNGVPIKINVK